MLKRRIFFSLVLFFALTLFIKPAQAANPRMKSLQLQQRKTYRDFSINESAALRKFVTSIKRMAPAVRKTAVTEYKQILKQKKVLFLNLIKQQRRILSGKDKRLKCSLGELKMGELMMFFEVQLQDMLQNFNNQAYSAVNFARRFSIDKALTIKQKQQAVQGYFKEDKEENELINQRQKIELEKELEKLCRGILREQKG
ncbi:MAG: hypothetical protein HY761_00805 [Candidatus Omnitrophica bacterium]|nr:hypothetical protein [Candidatus Omnitrophota bacterium]